MSSSSPSIIVAPSVTASSFPSLQLPSNVSQQQFHTIVQQCVQQELRSMAPTIVQQIVSQLNQHQQSYNIQSSQYQYSDSIHNASHRLDCSTPVENHEVQHNTCDAQSDIINSDIDDSMEMDISDSVTARHHDDNTLSMPLDNDNHTINHDEQHSVITACNKHRNTCS